MARACPPGCARTESSTGATITRGASKECVAPRPHPIVRGCGLGAPDPSIALPELRKILAPQLEAYAAILRNLHSVDLPIRAGLYYPRMVSLDWWEL